MLSGRVSPRWRMRLLPGVASVPGRVSPPALAQARLSGAASVSALPVIDHIAGTAVVDNYRWMEAAPPPSALIAYLHAATDAALSTLSRIPGREQMIQAVSALDARGIAISAMTPEYDVLYYLRRGA